MTFVVKQPITTAIKALNTLLPTGLLKTIMNTDAKTNPIIPQYIKSLYFSNKYIINLLVKQIPINPPIAHGISTNGFKDATAETRVSYNPSITSVREPLTPGSSIVTAVTNPANPNVIIDEKLNTSS